MWALGSRENKDQELNDLLSQLAAVQKQEPASQLNERVAVEIVLKLQSQGAFGSDGLINTIDGREYLTRSHLRKELAQLLESSGGRLTLSDAANALRVHALHLRAAAEDIADVRGADALAAAVSNAHSDTPAPFSVALVGGELLSRAYVEGTVASTLAAQLGCSGRVPVAALARELSLPSDVVRPVLAACAPRLSPPARLIRGHAYTDAHLLQLRGAARERLRAAREPVTLADLATELAGDGELDGEVVREAVAEMVGSGEVPGSLTAGGSRFEPSSHRETLLAQLASSLRATGVVTFKEAKARGVGRGAAALVDALGDAAVGAVALPTLLVGREAVEAARARVSEAVALESWVDMATVLPAAFTAPDIRALLAHLGQTGTALSLGVAGGQGRWGDAEGAAVVADTCAVSHVFLNQALDRLESSARAEAASQLRKGSNNNNNRGHAQGKGGGGRRGGTDGFQSQSQSQPQLQSMSVPDAAWVSSRLSSMFRDLEGAGADGGLVEGVAEMMVGEVRSCFLDTIATLREREAQSRDAARHGIAEVAAAAYQEAWMMEEGASVCATSLHLDTPTLAMVRAEAGSARGAVLLSLLRAADFLDGQPGAGDVESVREWLEQSAGPATVDLSSDRSPPPPPLASLLSRRGSPRAQAALQALQERLDAGGLTRPWLDDTATLARSHCGMPLSPPPAPLAASATAALCAHLTIALRSVDVVGSFACALPLALASRWGACVRVPLRAVPGVVKAMRAAMTEQEGQLLAEHASNVVDVLKGAAWAQERGAETLKRLVEMLCKDGDGDGDKDAQG